MKRLFILLLHLLTMSMAVYQRPNTKVPCHLLDLPILPIKMSSKLPNCRRICTEHLIFQQHSLLRGIKSESGEITTEDISRYCFEVLLGFSIYFNLLPKSWFTAHTAQSCNLLHQNNHLLLRLPHFWAALVLSSSSWAEK